MLAIKAPEGRSRVESGHTQGSLAYAVAALCANDFLTEEKKHWRHGVALAKSDRAEKDSNSQCTVVVCRPQEVERVAAEIELWLAALENRESEIENGQTKEAASKTKVVVLPGLPGVEDEEEDEALMLQREEKSVELLGVLGEIVACGGNRESRESRIENRRTIQSGTSASNLESRISNLAAPKPVVIVGDLEALTQPLPGNLPSVELRVGGESDMEELKARLAGELGYSHEVVCEAPGQFAMRGGIVDVYPVNAEAPVRLDFFGRVLEAIREFDPSTQRSSRKLDAVTFSAAHAGGDWRSGGLAGYLPERTRWVLLEPAELEAEHPEHFNVPEKIKAAAGHFANFVARPGDEWVGLARRADAGTFFEGAAMEAVAVETPAKYRPLPPAGLVGDERADAERRMLEGFVQKAKGWGARTVAFSRGEMAAEFKKILRPLHPVVVTGAIGQGFILKRKRNTDGTRTGTDETRTDKAKIVAGGSETEKTGAIRQTLQDEGEMIVALAPGDLPPYASVYTITRHSRKVARRSAVNELLDFSQVAEGDYLVHLEHGICRYRGITRLEDSRAKNSGTVEHGNSGTREAAASKRQGEKEGSGKAKNSTDKLQCSNDPLLPCSAEQSSASGEEVLSLEFDAGVVLHLRFSEAHLISRYVGLTKKHPHLSRIGAQTWAKAKKNAQQATMDFAAELLRLQAVRTSQPGFSFASDGELERQFDATFPYRLTSDQAKAIEATRADMREAKPMDRLVCGDVGFGKTEVALRAAIKAVASGKQVAILCPTTILSQQHFNTFNERAAGFGAVVECLNRFRSHKEQSAILKKLQGGQIDVVVGTHRLLSKDVAFKDLGLIVIDEEHRFGVEQKEQLKRLRLHADVLAMSATPIPRTLQMALGGARDLSIIETAPQNRRPIETVVRTFDEKVLKEAIEYEVGRGGQVFYLHNRVRTIARVALRLQELFPKLRIAVGHGKMNEEELERVMTDFVAGRYDVLVCTTIIESGLDIPNCNTLIIEGADQFGLSQLYQIRGRVGRFNRQAYAYLFLHKHKELADEAKDRLEALRVHNELGAGFRIAMRDLELRGSGNLLGPQQSGHIAGVGFELYCELLKESVARLKSGQKGKMFTPRTSVHFDFAMDTRIPAAYLPEARLRLEMNRELSLVETMEEFEELRAGMIDRFGKPPESVENLLAVTRIRVRSHEKGLVGVSTDGERLMLMRPDGSYVKQGALFPRLPEGKAEMKVKAVEAIVANLRP